MGGGQPSAAELHGADAPGEVPPGDQPNLEYSRKATDLVLDYLKDQQQNPDPGLLDRLGWTRDELQQFLTRWESLRRSARQDPAAGRELDEALRSLGLRAARPQPRSAAGPDDAVRGLRDAGSQSAPPASYLDQFRAYKKGTARTEGN
jgi:hypothetical protein